MLSDKFRIFTAVCECGGLTKAGEKLFISQPAISRCIKNLEEEMGTKLIAFRFGQMKKNAYYATWRNPLEALSESYFGGRKTETGIG